MKNDANDLICLSHLRWGFVYQRPNHLISRFARERRAFFFEEPVFDAQEGAPYLEERTTEPNLIVAVPHLPESFERARAEHSIEEEQRRLLDGMIAKHRITQPIAWIYTPMALGFASHVVASAAVVVYDCMDELSAFHGAPPALRARERELFARADVVFTGGQSLYESKKSQHHRVFAFPSSVDAAHFAHAREPLPEPSDQAAIARPRIGYFGVIDERIDLDLIARLADAQRAWQIVMVGPVVKIDAEKLPQRPNIHWLGQKTYAELPSYLAGWDVAIMPFALNESTRFISPTKTLEYLAAGKPVVSTPIRDVVRPYGAQHLVRIAQAGAFPGHVAAALNEDPFPRRARADAFVAGTSWDATQRRMRDILDDVIAEKRTRTSPAVSGPIVASDASDQPSTSDVSA